MAEEHDRLVAVFTRKVVKRKYRLKRKAPFVDYRPDVFAQINNRRLFAEIEIEKTLHSDHTMDQLLRMHEYLRLHKTCDGYLVVPKRIAPQARLLLESVFGDSLIAVEGL